MSSGGRGVRVITPPHGLGFLDPNLPEKSRPLEPELDGGGGADEFVMPWAHEITRGLLY